MDVVKQTPRSASSSYRTRSSLGIRPKKRQSYGDFIELPVKKRISSTSVTNPQKKDEKETVVPAPLGDSEHKEEFSAIALKDCFVQLERLPLGSKVRVPDTPSPTVSVLKGASVKKSMAKKCSFPGCTNTTQEEFYEMPQDSDTKEKWLKQLKKKHVPGLAVCSKHFDASDFIESSDQGKPLLKEGAVPKKATQSNENKSSRSSVQDIIEELLDKKFITEDNYKLLEPFKDLTCTDIELREKGSNKERVQSFIEAVRSCTEEACNLFKEAIPLPDIGPPASNSGTPSYRATIHELFPDIEDTNSINTSTDLVDVLIDKKLILEGVKALVEGSACFQLSSLKRGTDDSDLKQKIERFSRVVFLNSPQTYNKIREPLHLPTVLSIFPSLSSPENEIQLESLTLGQLLNEASRLNSMSEESIRSLIPFGGCQLCPYSSSTVSMYKHVISSIFFNAPMFFNFLAEYLPLPSILLFAKSPLSKECDSTADRAEPQTPSAEGNKKVSESPTSSTKKRNASSKHERQSTAKVSPTTVDVPISSESSAKDEFIRCICPKTGKNVAKLDVDTDGFLPKDLTVKVVGHILTITGCREENGQSTEFLKTVELPNFVDADQAGCYYFKGKMSIHAPVVETVTESDDQLSSSTNATNSECCAVGKEKADSRQGLEVGNSSTPKSIRKKAAKSNFSKPSLASNDDDLPRNVAVLMNVDGQEYVSLIAEVSKLFKPSEITVKVRENKIISVKGETRSSDPQSKSRLYALLEREFDLPKKIDKTTLKAGCPGDGFLKIFAKVASDQNGH